MINDCVKLTTYFGERDRVGDGFLSDTLIDIHERHRVEVSVLLRGIEGFGRRHRLQTQRFLTLSEDLPLVAIAVVAPSRIEAVLDEVQQLTAHGLTTLERARMVTGPTSAADLPPSLSEAAKLTVYLGRGERLHGRRADLAVIELLHRHGLAGATALLGVDGTAHGRRQRATLFGANSGVPVTIVSVGDGKQTAEAVEELTGVLGRPLITLERVRLCKRDGHTLTAPRRLPPMNRSGYALWQKLTIFVDEQARHRGQPLYSTLVRRLREMDADGATALRGYWGYQDPGVPHGDRFWSLRRHVPLILVILDRPERIQRSFAVVDELTDEAGLVTSEIVPALAAPTSGGGFPSMSMAVPVV